MSTVSPQRHFFLREWKLESQGNVGLHYILFTDNNTKTVTNFSLTVLISIVQLRFDNNIHNKIHVQTNTESVQCFPSMWMENITNDLKWRHLVKDVKMFINLF